MTNLRDHIRSWIVLLFKPRTTVIDVVKQVLGGIFIAQVLTVTILMLIAAIRRRNNHATSFPRIPAQEVCVGENALQLYSYGRDLFDAMFAAIENARESIYLESYIWKDDEVGKQFRDMLSRKAEEGVEVYVIYDKFGNLVIPSEFYKSFSLAIHRMEYLFVSRP